jgi:drug/metabolite transporter (DMT)-like permease
VGHGVRGAGVPQRLHAAGNGLRPLHRLRPDRRQPDGHAPAALLRRLDRNDIIAMVKHALAGNIVYYMLLALGVKLAGVAATSLIIGVLPISVTLMGHKDHGSVPLRQLMLPLLLVAAGIACINIDVFTHDVGNGMPLAPSCSACCAQPARWPAGPGIRSTTRAT